MLKNGADNRVISETIGISEDQLKQKYKSFTINHWNVCNGFLFEIYVLNLAAVENIQIDKSGSKANAFKWTTIYDSTSEYLTSIRH